MEAKVKVYQVVRGMWAPCTINNHGSKEPMKVTEVRFCVGMPGTIKINQSQLLVVRNSSSTK
jgi:hypothetical protein